jgi:hypothetical protein
LLISKKTETQDGRMTCTRVSRIRADTAVADTTVSEDGLTENSERNQAAWGIRAQSGDRSLEYGIKNINFEVIKKPG